MLCINALHYITTPDETTIATSPPHALVIMTNQSSSKAGNANNRCPQWIVGTMNTHAFSSAVSSAATRTMLVSSSSPEMRIVNLKDPSTLESRNYVILQRQEQTQASRNSGECRSNQSPMPKATILEIQSLPSDFSSFFVGRHVVGDGNFYVFNPMDPLFWVLSAQEPHDTPTKKRSWQPYHQMAESLFPVIASSTPARSESTTSTLIDLQSTQLLQQDQLSHLFQTLCNEQTNQLTYYKFCPTKAVRWLERKQEVLYRCLVKQQQVQRLQEGEIGNSSCQNNNRLGGSRSASFYLPDEDNPEVPVERSEPGASLSETGLDMATEHRLKVESLHILTSYISPAWSKKYFDSLSLGVTASVLTTSTTSKPMETSLMTKNPILTVPITQKDSNTKSKHKILQPSVRSVANKSLDKVNKKGMKKMSSFFGTVPVAKKAKSSKPIL
jgi:hypothetical protein